MMILQDLRNYYNKRTEFFRQYTRKIITVHLKHSDSTSEGF